MKYPSFTPSNGGRNSLVEPNDEGCFGPGLQSTLPYARRLHEHQSIPPASSKGRYEPHPPSPPNRQPYDTPSPLSNDFEHYTAKHQFSSEPNRDKSAPLSFRATSLQDSAGPSLLQVSIVPSVSFTIQDTTHLGSSGALPEDPLARARNVPYNSGDVSDRTLKPEPSHLKSLKVNP
jgi:hypothetical protein